MKIETICVQGGYQPKSGDPRTLPLVQSTTYYYQTPEELAHLFDVPKDGHIYSRISNPTTSAYEEKIAMLEGGVGAMATGSGMSAIMAAVMNVASKGDNILSMSSIYGGTFNLFKVTLPRLGIETKFFTDDMSDAEIEKLIDGNTKAVFVETIANPAMIVCDFDRYAAICRKHGVLLIVDNTLATPCLVRPFEHGANVVVHSSTKYLDGHASCVGGIIVDGGNFAFDGNPRYKDFYTPDASYHDVVYVKEGGAAAYILKARMQYMRDMGLTPSPFNAWLTNIGTETLHLRMERTSQNALALAETLKKHKNAEWVMYPGLKDDKYHDTAVKYYKGGFGGMLVFGVKGGRKQAENFIKNLSLVKQVTHIADVRSCVLHPASTTHRQLSDADLVKAGITANMVRLSLGIENIDDITADVVKALDNI